MHHYLRYWVPAFITAAWCLVQPSMAAQSSQSSRACTVQRAKATDSDSEGRLPTRIVDELVVQDAESMPAALRDEIENVTRHKTFPGTSGSEWTEELQEFVRQFLQNRGFFRALVEVHASLLQEDKRGAHYLATAIVQAGAQYRLGDVRFQDNKAFPSDELRKLIPLQTGDLLDVSKVREGIEAISRRYGEIGYIDTAVEPQTEITEDRSQVSLTMIVFEEKRYVVDEVTILGGEPRLRSIVQSTFVSGKVFSSSEWYEFFEKTQSLFAGYGAESDRMWLERNPAVGAISLTFDLRPCSTGSGLLP